MIDGTNIFGAVSVQDAPGVYRIRRDVMRLMTNEPQSPWRGAVKARLDEIASLPLGWDGYVASAPSFSICDFCLRMLDVVCSESTPLPFIVPGSASDLQVEWHRNNIDIELHIVSPNNVHAWILERDNEQEREREFLLRSDFRSLTPYIEKLADIRNAADAAAA